MNLKNNINKQQELKERKISPFFIPFAVIMLLLLAVFGLPRDFSVNKSFKEFSEEMKIEKADIVIKKVGYGEIYTYVEDFESLNYIWAFVKNSEDGKSSTKKLHDATISIVLHQNDSTTLTLELKVDYKEEMVYFIFRDEKGRITLMNKDEFQFWRKLLDLK